MIRLIVLLLLFWSGLVMIFISQCATSPEQQILLQIKECDQQNMRSVLIDNKVACRPYKELDDG